MLDPVRDSRPKVDPSPLPESDGGEVHIVRRGTERWWVSNGWHDRLLGKGAPVWFAPATGREARLEKQGHHRSIWRIALEHGAVYLKLGSRRTGLRGLWDRIRGDPLVREWRLAATLRRRGVPVVRMPALGRRPQPAPQSALISEEVPGSVTLRDWLDRLPSLPRRQEQSARRSVIPALATLLSTSHQRGFVHRDPHPGNILVLANGNGGKGACLFVDAYGGQLSKGPAAEQSIAWCLARLAHATRRAFTSTDRLRFFFHYVRQVEASSVDPSRKLRWNPRRKALWHAVRERAARHAEQLARHRDRRLRRNGAYFVRLHRSDGWRVQVVLKLGRRVCFPEPSVPDRILSDWECLVWKNDGPHQLESLELRCKLLRPHGLFQRLTWTFLGSPHRKAFEACHRRRHRDQPGGLALGVAEHRRFGLIDRTVLIIPK